MIVDAALISYATSLKQQSAARAAEMDSLGDQFESNLEQADEEIVAKIAAFQQTLLNFENDAVSELQLISNKTKKPLGMSEVQAIQTQKSLKVSIEMRLQLVGKLAYPNSTQTTSLQIYHRMNTSLPSQIRGTQTVLHARLRPISEVDMLLWSNDDGDSKSKRLRGTWFYSSLFPITRSLSSLGDPTLVTSKDGGEKFLKIRNPWGIAVHPADGSIYVTEHNDGRFVHFNHSLSGDVDILQRLGDRGGETFTILGKSAKNPRGVSVSVSGRIAMADYGANSVYLFDENMNVLESIQNTPSSVSHFSAPYNVAFDPEECFYVSDSGNRRVVKFDRDGQFLFEIKQRSTSVPAPEHVREGADPSHYFSSSVNGIMVDSAGNLYVLQAGGEQIFVFHSDGSYKSTIPIQKFGSGGWGFLARGPDDVVIVSDYNQHHIRFYDTEGEILKEIPHKGPLGVSFHPDGRLYVLEHDSNSLFCYNL
eukprot:TRINITY_DN5691_c0_g1_i1.p1 TRINITY_DN5691_c0_g1~~TRINITY_DN5691_c0_g1_i1.p1  ORF type:complete len:478 (-),score=106.04 TRINITY_DN5691_c0_g1_i1:265-1698(-)